MREARGLEYETCGEGEPVLLIHGSHVAESFLPLTREAALAAREAPKALFRASVPQAEEVVLPGLNHLLQLRDPRRVAETITSFLARHPL